MKRHRPRTPEIFRREGQTTGHRLKWQIGDGQAAAFKREFVPSDTNPNLASMWVSVCPPQVLSRTPSEIEERPQIGCYIHGLFLEGARWDPLDFQLAESRPKELYTEMAVIWLMPVANRKVETQDFYLCPIYKTLTRAGKATQGRPSTLQVKV